MAPMSKLKSAMAFLLQQGTLWGPNGTNEMRENKNANYIYNALGLSNRHNGR